MIVGSGRTHTGKVRRHNEDGLLVDVSLGLYIVADGMGGHKAGEVASSLAIESIHSFLLRARQDDDHTWPFGLEATLDVNGNRLRTAVKLANRRVFRESERRDEFTGMGTTVAAVLAEGSSTVVCGVGDSRVYLVGPSAVKLLTRDHTWVETLLAQNPELDRGKLANHPMRHVLTSVIGAQDDVDVSIVAQSLERGDRLVLCTDGVHGAMEEHRLAAVVREASSPADAADKLVAEALERDGRDNLTAIVVEAGA